MNFKLTICGPFFRAQFFAPNGANFSGFHKEYEVPPLPFLGAGGAAEKFPYLAEIFIFAPGNFSQNALYKEIETFEIFKMFKLTNL